MKSIERISKLILIVFLIFVFLFSLKELVIQISYGYINSPEVFFEAKSFSKAQCYAGDKYIYLVDTNNGVIQCFSYEGQFIKGYKTPSRGGLIWVGSNDNLYIYCIRKNAQVTIQDGEIIYDQNIFYTKETDFYASNNINNANLCIVKGNTVYIEKGNVKYEIQLNAEKRYLSNEWCIFLLVICYFGFMLVTGLYKILLDMIDKQYEKEQRFHHIDKRKL